MSRGISFIWGYGHYLVLGSVGALGAGLQLAAASSQGGAGSGSGDHRRSGGRGAGGGVSRGHRSPAGASRPPAARPGGHRVRRLRAGGARGWSRQRAGGQHGHAPHGSGRGRPRDIGRPAEPAGHDGHRLMPSATPGDTGGGHVESTDASELPPAESSRPAGASARPPRAGTSGGSGARSGGTGGAGRGSGTKGRGAAGNRQGRPATGSSGGADRRGRASGGGDAGRPTSGSGGSSRGAAPSRRGRSGRTGRSSRGVPAPAHPAAGAPRSGAARRDRRGGRRPTDARHGQDVDLGTPLRLFLVEGRCRSARRAHHSGARPARPLAQAGRARATPSTRDDEPPLPSRAKKWGNVARRGAREVTGATATATSTRRRRGPRGVDQGRSLHRRAGAPQERTAAGPSVGLGPGRRRP